MLGDVDEVAGGKREANAAQAVCCGDHRCSRPFIEQRSLGVRRRANVCELAGALPHADALPQLHGGSTLLPCARQTWERLTHALLRPSVGAATALSASHLRKWGTCRRGSALTHGDEVTTNGRTVTEFSDGVSPFVAGISLQDCPHRTHSSRGPCRTSSVIT